MSAEFQFKKELIQPIPAPLLEKACTKIGIERGPIPFKCREIKITKELVKVTLEILNNEPSRALPQNHRNEIAEKTPDGLDRRIKLLRNNNRRTANIISDVLAEAGIVKRIQVRNPSTDRLVKDTQLNETWTW